MSNVYPYRYQVQNVMLHCLTPGPFEFTSDELQYVLKLIVDDLINLYEVGIIIATPSFPKGRLLQIWANPAHDDTDDGR